jgi:hypothetical protein
LAQIFPRSANRLPVVLALGAVLGPTLAVAFVWYYFSPRFTDVGYQPVQPVPYSHRLHAGELQIDCRYCHASVEISPIANVPPTQACMNCHGVLAVDSPALEPIRESFANETPMRWVRVHKVGEYAYFDHHVHVLGGIGCVSCHGHIEQMEVVRQAEPLSMGWCLDCHRNPDPHRRPLSEITNMSWRPPADPEQRARQLEELPPVHPPVECSGCHR